MEPSANYNQYNWGEDDGTNSVRPYQATQIAEAASISTITGSSNND